MRRNAPKGKIERNSVSLPFLSLLATFDRKYFEQALGFLVFKFIALTDIDSPSRSFPNRPKTRYPARRLLGEITPPQFNSHRTRCCPFAILSFPSPFPCLASIRSSCSFAFPPYMAVVFFLVAILKAFYVTSWFLFTFQFLLKLFFLGDFFSFIKSQFSGSNDSIIFSFSFQFPKQPGKKFYRFFNSRFD